MAAESVARCTQNLNVHVLLDLHVLKEAFGAASALAASIKSEC